MISAAADAKQHLELPCGAVRFPWPHPLKNRRARFDVWFDGAGRVWAPPAKVSDFLPPGKENDGKRKNVETNLIPDGAKYRHPDDKRACLVLAEAASIVPASRKPGKDTMLMIAAGREALDRFRDDVLGATQGLRDEIKYDEAIARAVEHASTAVASTAARAAMLRRMVLEIPDFAEALGRALEALAELAGAKLGGAAADDAADDDNQVQARQPAGQPAAQPAGQPAAHQAGNAAHIAARAVEVARRASSAAAFPAPAAPLAAAAPSSTIYDPDWEPTEPEAAVALRQLTHDHVRTFLELVKRHAGRTSLLGEYQPRQVKRAAIANLSHWRDLLPSASVTAGTYRTVWRRGMQLLSVWAALRPALEASRAAMAGELGAAKDGYGRPLVKVFGLHRPLMSLAPDNLELLRSGYWPLAARMSLSCVWKAGQPRPDHFRSLFTTEGQRKGINPNGRDHSGACVMIAAMKNANAGRPALLEELADLDAFYGGLLTHWKNRPKSLPRKASKASSGPMAWLLVAAAVQAQFQTFQLADAGLPEPSPRTAEAARQFAEVALAAGYISQGRSGDAAYIAVAANKPKPGRGAPRFRCVHPSCADPTNCMGLRFMEAGEVLTDAHGVSRTAREPCLFQSHHKTDAFTADDDVHFVPVPEVLASALRLMAGAGRRVLLRVHGKTPPLCCVDKTPRTATRKSPRTATRKKPMMCCDEPRTLLLTVTGDEYSPGSNEQMLKDVFFTASRLLGLPRPEWDRTRVPSFSTALITDADASFAARENAELFEGLRRKLQEPPDPEESRPGLPDDTPWAAVSAYTCVTDLRKQFLACRGDAQGLSLWAHEAARLHQRARGEEPTGLSFIDPDDRSTEWDFVRARAAKTSLAKMHANYSRGLEAHRVMMNVYSWIRQYFVFGDADVLKRKRAANQAPLETLEPPLEAPQKAQLEPPLEAPLEAPLEPPAKARKTS